MPSATQTDLLAVFSLATLLLVLAGYVVRQQSRLRLTWAQSFWYCVNYAIVRFVWRGKVDRALPAAGNQGAVIVSNHRSSVDPCFIEVATNRVVHWMVAKEYFALRSLGWFLRLAEAVPTSRGGIDTQSTKMAIRLAQSGGLVGVFPEARINRTDKLLIAGRSGAAMIALKARVPVIPCYIRGAPYDGTTLGCLFMPANVSVRIGQLIDLSEFYGRENERGVLEQVTRQLLAAIATLAGQPDFEPEVAVKQAKRL